MGSRWQDSTIEEEEKRLSLDQFDALTQKHLTSITEVQQKLSIVCDLFKEKGEIRPIQCRRAIEALNEVNEHVYEFCELLHEASLLPIVFTALRYRLLVTLYLIEEKSSELIVLIDSYRMACFALSPDEGRQRQKIYNDSTRLLQHIADISHKVNFLNDEARFQEQRLITDPKEESTADNSNTDNLDSRGRLIYLVKKHESTVEGLKDL